MYKMVSEFGNELKFVNSIAKRNALLEKGWHEEKEVVIPEKTVKETETNGKKTGRAKKNIQ